LSPIVLSDLREVAASCCIVARPALEVGEDPEHRCEFVDLVV
jgi:hypothetical protein